MKKISKLYKNKDVQLWAGMIIGSIVYSFGIVFVLDLGEFFAGGVTGIAQVITSALAKFVFPGTNLNGVKSVLIILINIPLFLIGWRGVSKRFAIASLCSVGFQSLLIAGFEWIQDSVGDPLYQLAENGDILTLAILGGLLTGAGCGICLKYGCSTGGMDILSQFVSLKKNISFAKFTFMIDLIIIISSIFVGSPVTAVYTIIRMILSVLVLDKIHTIYKNMKISIVTDKRDEMRQALLKQSNHGITIYDAQGGYSLQPKYVLESVISSFESFEISRIAREVDPKCFITYTSIKKIEGLYNQSVIV